MAAGADLLKNVQDNLPLCFPLSVGHIDHVENKVGFHDFFQGCAECRYELVRQFLNEPHCIRDQHRKIPAELYSTRELQILRTPWQGATWRDLAYVCESDAAAAGNSYWIREGDELVVAGERGVELDAAVAKAQKAAGMQAPADTRFASDRSALIEELRAEREQHARDAEAALAAAEVGEEAPNDEIVPGIKDPFKRAE